MPTDRLETLPHWPCPQCGAPLVFIEHLPTDERGTYRWECGRETNDNGRKGCPRTDESDAD